MEALESLLKGKPDWTVRLVHTKLFLNIQQGQEVTLKRLLSLWLLVEEQRTHCFQRKRVTACVSLFVMTFRKTYYILGR